VSEAKKIWVTEIIPGADYPEIREYTLVREAKVGYIVSVRGSNQHIKPSSGRQFWLSSHDMWAYVTGYVERKLATARRRVGMYEEALKDVPNSVPVNRTPDHVKISHVAQLPKG